MDHDRVRFDRFTLDPRDRSLCRDGVPVELNARYFDALVLLVGDAGRLVSKDRFMAEVWRGIPVTDEALTQCIRTLRRTLGDAAHAPRFIETVPRHGYRFVMAVRPVGAGADAADEDRPRPDPVAIKAGLHPSHDPDHAPAPPDPPSTGIRREGAEASPHPAPAARWHPAATTIAAATAGGVLAGLAGGLTYGFAGAAQPLLPGTGASAVVLVLLCVTLVMATIGAIGTGVGIAIGAALARRGAAIVAGGAIGGALTGAIVKLLGTDLFGLLFGRSPGDITGAFEGLVLGAAVGGGVIVARALARHAHPGRGVAAATAIGGTAGAGIALTGGRLLGGSLALLADAFPASRLRLDPLGRWFGETGFGPVTQVATAALEGALFAGCIAGMVVLADRRSAAAVPLVE